MQASDSRSRGGFCFKPANNGVTRQGVEGNSLVVACRIQIERNNGELSRPNAGGAAQVIAKYCYVLRTESSRAGIINLGAEQNSRL